MVFNSRHDLVTLFLQIPAEAEATTWRGCCASGGRFCVIPQVLSRVWNVGGQYGPGVSKDLDNLAIPSVSVRPGGCLFLLCLMHVGLSAGIALSCSSRRRYHEFVRGTSRLCGCVQHGPRLLQPQLRLAGATAAVPFRRHGGYDFGAPAAAALFVRRHILLVYLVGLVCLIGLVYLLVCLLVGLLACLVGLMSLIWVGWSRLSYRSGLEVGLFGWSGLSGWSGLCIAMSVGMLVWVTIVVTHGDLAIDSGIGIFAGCWFGSQS